MMPSILKRFVRYVAIGFASTLFQTVAFAQDAFPSPTFVCEDPIVKIAYSEENAEIFVDSLDQAYLPSSVLSYLVNSTLKKGTPTAETCALLTKAIKADVVIWVEKFGQNMKAQCESIIQLNNQNIAACEKTDVKVGLNAEIAELTFLTRDFGTTPPAEVVAARNALKAEILASETTKKADLAAQLAHYRERAKILISLQTKIAEACALPGNTFETATDKALELLDLSNISESKITPLPEEN